MRSQTPFAASWRPSLGIRLRDRLTGMLTGVKTIYVDKSILSEHGAKFICGDPRDYDYRDYRARPTMVGGQHEPGKYMVERYHGENGWEVVGTIRAASDGESDIVRAIEAGFGVRQLSDAELDEYYNGPRELPSPAVAKAESPAPPAARPDYKSLMRADPVREAEIVSAYFADREARKHPAPSPSPAPASAPAPRPHP